MVCGGDGWWWVDFGLGFKVVAGGWVWFVVVATSGGLILGWGL